MARQEWRVQSANLTQVLRLDPRAVVEPTEHDHLQITLIDPGKSLEELMPIALKNRPEVASNQALVPPPRRRSGGRSRAVPAQHHPQRLPDPVRAAPGRHLRPRVQHQPEPVDGPRRHQRPAPLAAHRRRDRQPRDDQAATGPAVAGDRRAIPPQDMVVADVTRALARVQSAAAGSTSPIGRCARASSPTTGTSRACRKPSGSATSWS